MLLFDNVQIPLVLPHRLSSISSKSLYTSSSRQTPLPLPPGSKPRSRHRFDPGRQLFAKRDICSDQLGSNRSNKLCEESATFTLCCLDSPNAFPQCQTHLGKGWCITGPNAGDRSYVDQASSCSEDGAVQCTVLAAGASKACCPKGTKCASEIPASESLVRCDTTYSELLKADGLQLIASASTSTSPTSASPSPSTSTSTSASIGSSSTASFNTSTSASASLTTTAGFNTTGPHTLASDPHGAPTGLATSSSSLISAASTAPTPASPSTQPLTGPIAGTAVGSFLAAAVLLAIVLFFHRRRKKKKTKLAQIQHAQTWKPELPSTSLSRLASTSKHRYTAYELPPAGPQDLSHPLPHELPNTWPSQDHGPFQLP